jgi:tryptophanyl-tRNA synthetase
MQRILSGIRPTGGIHIGNYLGALKQWVELSHESKTQCFFMIADYHALLSFRETPLHTASLDLLAWQMASGLNPHKVTLFIQSSIAAHTELAWILNAFVTVPELSRMTQYKDLIAQGTEKPSSALLTYPCLEAADILLYKADIVPIGEDQVQHMELTRTLAQRFNSLTEKEYFTLPKGRLTFSKRILSLHDPSKKMSKSLPQGALLLEDDEATLRSKISKAVTDSGPQLAPFPDEVMTQNKFSIEQRVVLYEHMTPGTKNLFMLLQDLCDDDDLIDTFLHNYRNQTLQYKDLKAAVADAVVEFVIPLQEKYKTIRENEAELKTILHEGNAKANAVASETLNEVKELLKILS